ncbi:nicotinamide mononucleotide transporter, partial [Acinetobacter baumannii]
CVLDVIYVGMYTHKSLYLTAVLYFLFILLALNGWRMWRNLYRVTLS